MKQTIPQNKIAALLSQATSMTPEQADRFISDFFRLTSDSLQESGTVEINNFGRFIVADGTVEFYPCEEIADSVNEPFSFFEPVELKEDVTESILEGTPSRPAAPQQSVPDASEEKNADDSLPADTLINTPEISSGETEKEISGCHSTEDKGHDSADSGLCDLEYNPEEESDGESLPEPEVIYEPVYQTRPWPVILGVILGAVVGFIIGFLVVRTLYPSQQAVQNTVVAVYESENDEVIAPLNDSVASELPEATLNTSEDSLAISTLENEIEVPSVASVVYDTVTPHRFLATMARDHYGVTEYWIFIFEENRSSLPANPNRITPGTPVIIPPLDKYVPSGSRSEGRAKAAEMIRKLEKNL